MYHQCDLSCNLHHRCNLGWQAQRHSQRRIALGKAFTRLDRLASFAASGFVPFPAFGHAGSKHQNSSCLFSGSRVPLVQNQEVKPLLKFLASSNEALVWSMFGFWQGNTTQMPLEGGMYLRGGGQNLLVSGVSFLRLSDPMVPREQQNGTLTFSRTSTTARFQICTCFTSGDSHLHFCNLSYWECPWQLPFATFQGDDGAKIFKKRNEKDTNT